MPSLSVIVDDFDNDDRCQLVQINSSVCSTGNGIDIRLEYQAIRVHHIHRILTGSILGQLVPAFRGVGWNV